MELRSLLRILGACALVTASGAACGSRDGDPPFATGTPSAIGAGARIREISNPDASTHAKSQTSVVVTGAVVVTTDKFDETKNGKSRGAVYVEDVGSQAPFSGISLFSPSFVPQDLRIAPGDVLDLSGQYQENGSIGSTTTFPAGQVLTQISKPVASFRFESAAPTPTVIDAADLADYAKGRRWMSMLVTVKNVTLAGDLTAEQKSGGATGRVTGTLDSGAIVTNELYDLQPDDFAAGQTFSSVTGIVTYFFDLHIAPRSAADWVQ